MAGEEENPKPVGGARLVLVSLAKWGRHLG